MFCAALAYSQLDSILSTKRRKSVDETRKRRPDRQTYTIPEPCLGCPGENGLGVSLTVERKPMYRR